MVSLARGQRHLVRGEWGDMLRLCDEGTRILVQRCHGVAWERDIGAMAAIRALEELGRVPEVRSRVAQLRRDAEARDDRYAEVTARLYGAFWEALQGDAAAARREAEAALARWPAGDFHLQHLYALRIHAFCDVLAEEPDRGFRRVQEAWPALKRAGLLRHALLRTDALALRARLALAAAGCASDRRRRALLRCAARDARHLASAGRPDAVALAALFHAALAVARRDRDGALAHLDRAIEGYACADMPLLAASVQRRKGDLLVGEAGRALRAAADAALAERGVHDPERWIALVAPGLPGHAPNQPMRGATDR